MWRTNSYWGHLNIAGEDFAINKPENRVNNVLKHRSGYVAVFNFFSELSLFDLNAFRRREGFHLPGSTAEI